MGNKDNDLNIAAMNDYVHTFLQVVGYHQFVKGCVEGVGSNKQQLRLYIGQRCSKPTCDLGVLQTTLFDMLAAEDLYTHETHMESVEI